MFKKIDKRNLYILAWKSFLDRDYLKLSLLNSLKTLQKKVKDWTISIRQSNCTSSIRSTWKIYLRTLALLSSSTAGR